MIRPPFPSVLDSSLLSAFRSCPQKALLEYFHHFRPAIPNVHLLAGGAYAAGLDAARSAYFIDGLGQDEAAGLGATALMKHYGNYECPPDSAKSLERMLGALEFYLDTWPFESDPAQPIHVSGPKKRGIEMGFSEPVDLDDPEMRHPITGDPLIYCGRADMVADYQSMVLGEDDKTTSSLGASWTKQWDLRSQFTGYSWGFRKMGIPIQGWLIRGVSILKNKYDKAEAITYRPDWQIERWHLQLKRDITRMKFMWETGYFDYNLDHACAEFGGCGFRQVCLMKLPEAILSQQFERRRWDPIRRKEIPVVVTEAGEFLEQEVM